MRKQFTVSASDHGSRLDQFLTGQFRGEFSRSYLQHLIDEGKVLINQNKVKRHGRVRQGDRVELELEDRQRPWLAPETIPLDILYEDEDVLLVNKPAGMVVHPACGNYSGTLVHALLAHSPNFSQFGDSARPGIVHRLDKETSGVLVIAKNPFAHQALAKQFLERTVTKKYLAIVRGRVAQEEGMIEFPIGRHPFHRQKMSVAFGRTRSRSAQTRYKVLQRFAQATLLQVEPTTGRTHQIRVHLSSIGHPILGDDTYGGTDISVPRMVLHASSLKFAHPRTKQIMEVKAELPKDLKEVISKL